VNHAFQSFASFSILSLYLSVLWCLCPIEDSFSSLKIKHDKKKAKSYLYSSSGEDDICSLVTKDDRKMAPGTELFVSMGRLREQSPEA
jgi:hypothetical protein